MDVKTNHEKRDDGSVWKRYKTSTGIEVVVTSAFREVMRNWQSNIIDDGKDVPGSFLRLLHKYRRDYEHNATWNFRRYVASWFEASFFAIQESNIGIREERHAWKNEDKIDRMDRIQHLLELGSVPRWIHAPVHYGMLKIPQMRQWYYDKFLLMEKVDWWVTAFDIIDEPRNENIRNSIVHEFGPAYWFDTLDGDNYEVFRNEIKKKYVEVKVMLKTAFDAHRDQFPGWTFSSLFTDLLQRNFIVTHNQTPIGNSKVSFWIIDQ
jgi:hypothetical protein